MIELPDKKIYIYYKDVDFRKGVASLNSLINVSFPDQDLTDSLFLFFLKTPGRSRSSRSKVTAPGSIS